MEDSKSNRTRRGDASNGSARGRLRQGWGSARVIGLAASFIFPAPSLKEAVSLWMMYLGWPLSRFHRAL